ncbi:MULTISPECIES: M66 family metalloprotease [unclassified Pseudomonas]|uniref:M66 family metalloprotease n=1 Tax=unclassified Pseudomonas TaxID=196821 RepID=UPI000F7879C1|nr:MULTISPECIES: M66 family metalloprotease [unclassified Pseudomonas]RRV46637.1 ToxR-regulated lipoprotein [Pseudomonas sp. p106]
METVLALTMRDDCLYVEPYTGDISQHFRVVPQNDGSIGIRALRYDAALTMSEDDVWVSPYGGNAWQSFELQAYDDGTYTLHSMNYPAVLEMTDAGAAAKAHAQKDRAQRFYLESRPDGGVVIYKASVVFDTCGNTNHLQGSLAAHVKFAQSQIVPVTPSVGDEQPHLVAGRTALLLVKPLGALKDRIESLEVSVVDRDGRLSGVLQMNSPYDLPETVYSVASDAGDLDFSLPPEDPYVINSSSELDRLDDPAATYLKATLRSHDWVVIQTGDGSWVSDIYLPTQEVVCGQRVSFNSAAGYSSTVFYSGRSVVVSKGEECQFIFAAGQWISDHEWANRMLVYSENTWSIEIPGAWLNPGTSMRFSAGDLLGTLGSVAVGGRTELLIHTIDIGMLTPPRDEYAFANEPDAHTEYFQTIPVARMIVSNYQSLHLPEVMLPDGQLLTDFDPSEGGWHSGTMRQRIGKELISLGINNANYGLHSTPGEGEQSPYVAAQLTAHNSQGRYVNGIQVHGGSGGGGIVTLDDSLGNEFSHEVGHNYGLGHYPGGFGGSVHRPAQALNATWGWDMRLGQFIPNFRANITQEPTCVEDQCQAPFHGHAFGLDPMAGGAPMSHLNRFTLHTPHTAAITQEFFEGKAVFASDSATGFRRWSALAQGMEPYAHRVDLRPQLTAPNNDLSDAALSALFDLNTVVRVEMEDGNWAPRIEVPRAASSNANCVITFNHDAGYNSQLSINGQTLNIGRGFFKSYRSNGATWTETILLDTSMARITVPNNDLSQANLQSLLAGFAVLNVVMRDGDWGPAIHVPPASELNERRVISIDQGAAYQTQLHINGLILPLSQGSLRLYMSEGGAWREYTHAEDVSVERVPQKFGVPITTLVGYYDPQRELPHYIYPALHGAYGFVYEDDSGASANPGWQLWVVTVAGVRRYNLPGIRLQANVMNKFHVNLDTSDRPEKVQLVYRGETLFTRTLEPPQEELVYTINGE